MDLILAWVLFPLVLAAVGAGWGAVVEWAAGSEVSGALLIPLGLAAVIVVTSMLTLWTDGSFTAPAALPVVAVVAVAGLIGRRPFRRLTLWPALVAVGLVLVYGAPVILSGSATFLGYIRLDDTATWLDVTDHAMTHLQLPANIVPSTYATTFIGDVGPTYPLGSFMLLAAGHAFTGIDAAWIFQPYLACCGAALGLSIYTLLAPLIESPRIRAFAAFFAAQPALLFGYSLWGGIKELTAAFLLALAVTLLAQVIVKRPRSPRMLLALVIVAAALILTLGVGSATWIVPAVAIAFGLWLHDAWPGRLWSLGRDLGVLAAGTAVLALPVWLTLSQFFSERSAGLFRSGTHTPEEYLGNLYQALSGWQLAGIWPVGDFRVPAPTVPSVLLIGAALIAAAGGMWMALRRRQPGVVVYVAVALGGCGIFYLINTTPWVLGKGLAVSAPALLTAALAGAGMLWSRHRAGAIVAVVLAGGVVWSNVLGYHDAVLAPRARLAELQHIGTLLAGKGPTFVNEYEIYADRHFLRAGDPVEPAEYRPVTLALRNGTSLIKSAWADLDSFPLSTLEPYRSIVTRRMPSESRPPSIYNLVWGGRYYQLWQRPEPATTRIIEHVPLGESNKLPYCGAAQAGTTLPLCSANPVAVPPCSLVERLGRRALRDHAELVAYQRPQPVVVRGDQVLWPAPWIHGTSERTLTPTTSGQAVAHIEVTSTQRYELFLGGAFSRGFDVSVDGGHVARVKDELSNIGGYAPVGKIFLTGGVHSFVLSYPHSDLTPGSGDTAFTGLSAIALQPLEVPSTGILRVPPQQAKTLCGQPLDWVEIILPGA